MDNPQQETQAQTESKIRKFKLNDLLTWLLSFVIVGLIFIVGYFKCNFRPVWLLVSLLAGYFVLLAINYLNLFEKKVGWFFSLLLALMPVLVLIVTGGWAWWAWLLIIILYFATLITYALGVLDEKFWQVIIPLSLFLLFLLFLI